MRRVQVPVELTLGDRTIQGSAAIPAALMRPADLLPVLESVDSAVVGLAIELAERIGVPISCRAGCGACCRQLVPIALSEALYLAELVEAMPAARQARVRGRFLETLARLPEAMLTQLHGTASLKDVARRNQVGIDYFRLGIPCPFLEHENCSIYPHRPMRCREYLVTSPAENCAHPSPDSIAMVKLPVRPSTVLYCFEDGIGNMATDWVPLILLLDFAAARRAQPQPTFDAPQMLRNFVAQVAAMVKSTNDEGGVHPRQTPESSPPR